MLLAPSTPRPQPKTTPRAQIASANSQVVRGELARAVAERLERRDLLALRADDARQEHVQEERGDAEEDDRQRPRHLLELPDLLVDELGRRLIGAAHRAEAAVRLEDRVDAIDRLALVGAHGELDRRRR